jgi:hypothetical protein
MRAVLFDQLTSAGPPLTADTALKNYNDGLGKAAYYSRLLVFSS